MPATTLAQSMPDVFCFLFLVFSIDIAQRHGLPHGLKRRTASARALRRGHNYIGHNCIVMAYVVIARARRWGVAHAQRRSIRTFTRMSMNMSLMPAAASAQSTPDIKHVVRHTRTRIDMCADMRSAYTWKVLVEAVILSTNTSMLAQ